MKPPALELDPLRVAGLGAMLGGVAALVQPFFVGLAVAGAGLAGAAWLPKARRDRSGWAGGAAILGSWAFYLIAPASFRSLAALALGTGALLLVFLGEGIAAPVGRRG